MLVLVLGTKDNKLYCLDTDKLNSSDKEFIRSRNNYFSKLGLEDRITQLRDVRPSVMKCYRTISTSNFVVDKEYSINSSS